MTAETRRRWAEMIGYAAGLIIMSAAYPLFFLANDIAPGGLSGVAMLLREWLPLNVGMMTFILNLPLFVLGYRQRGFAFIARSFLAMTVTSMLIDALPFAPLTRDPLLAALGGGALLGIGLGLVIRANATTGGTDMAAMMLHKRFPILSIGGILLAIDCVVILGAAVVFEPQSALYALAALYVSTRTMDAVVTGFDTAKAFFIISDEHAVIAQKIMTELERGVTLLHSKGAYTGAEREVLLCVVTRTQAPQLRRIVLAADPKAFLIATEVREAMGEGFEKTIV
ncbi:membrane protein [Clostridia bacterium]|nr:membrane protein [Clostridia bacterium]